MAEAFAWAGQAFMHMPQCAAVASVSMHAPSQFSRPLGHEVPHWPPEQTSRAPHGWSQAPYGSKAEVDASFKRLLDRALDPAWGEAVRVGLGSHNLFDVAWGLVRADRLGTRHRLELEMLEGMAPGAAEAARRQAGGIRLYAPVVRHDEFDAVDGLRQRDRNDISDGLHRARRRT